MTLDKQDQAEDFAAAVVDWYHNFGRKHLPWQQGITPYRVWLSEIMLQQTQVTTVIPYFERFTSQYPDFQALADADIDDVLHLWTGLGYYARARNLHRCAQQVVADYDGEMPDSLDALEQLPGIGRSTAGAIVSLAFQRRAAILDGNVKRVLARCFAVEGWPGQTRVQKQLWQLAEQLTPENSPRQYTQAMMDLGATVCARSSPQCSHCPVVDRCLAHATGNEDQFPGRRPKKDKPVKQVQMLMLRNPGGDWLLEQRPPTGIWGGLWSFPELNIDLDVAQAATELMGCDVQLIEHWDSFRHTFSHYHLDISPVVLDVSAVPATVGERAIQWYNARLPSRLGLAAPVKALLDKLQ